MTKDELVKMLADNLTIKVEGGDFTDPNKRTVVIRFDDFYICGAEFDVVQKREYEG